MKRLKYTPELDTAPEHPILGIIIRRSSGTTQVGFILPTASQSRELRVHCADDSGFQTGNGWGNFHSYKKLFEWAYSGTPAIIYQFKTSARLFAWLARHLSKPNTH